MIRYALKRFLKGLGARPVLFVLTVAGVALGVASVVSVQLLNQGAIAAFRQGLAVTSGGADLVVRPVGGSLSSGALARALGTPGVTDVQPAQRVSVLIEGVGDAPVRYQEILGLDLLGGSTLFPQPVEGAGDSPREGPDATLLWTGPGVALTESTARELAEHLGRPLALGDRLTLGHGTRTHEVRVAYVFPGEDLPALMDLAWSQELFGSGLTQLNVTVSQNPQDGEGPTPTRTTEPLAEDAALAAIQDVAVALQERLGPGVRITTPSQEGLEGEDLLSAFRLNLTALSLISVFVGAFLVYGTTRASLVRRRGELGVLRSLGASRGQLLALIAGEVGFLGLAGVAIGLPAGYLAARANLDAVSGTVTNLYLLDAIRSLPLSPGVVLLAVATGLAAAAAGGALPAVETVGARIRSLLSGREGRPFSGWRPWKLLLGAAALWGAAGAVLATGWIHRGMATAFFLIGAVPLMTPAFIEALTRGVHPKRLGLAYALRTLAHRLQSVGVAVAGLAVAVAMMVGITVMVASFRASLSGWIERTVQADVYVSSAAWRGDRDTPGLDAGLVARMTGNPGVEAVDLVRGFRGRASGRPVALRGVRLDLLEPGTRFQVLRGSETQQASGVYVSEPFARKTGLGPGDAVAIETPEGVVQPPILAVVRDYGSEAGAITMDIGQMARWFGPGEPQGAALYVRDGVDADAVLAQVGDLTRGYGLSVRSNRALRENALQIFDQTFRITVLLQGMALLIATVGVTLTLIVLGTDEAGQLALYRALGATRGQVFRFFVAKGTVIAAIGAVLGTVAGLALAAVLVHVVNPAYFGWSLDTHVPVRTLMEQTVWVLAAAAVASLVPAASASRPASTALNPVEA